MNAKLLPAAVLLAAFAILSGCSQAKKDAAGRNTADPASAYAPTDWPHWKGAGWDGKSAETDWSPEKLTENAIRWRAEVGNGYSSTAVVGGKLYTSGRKSGEETVYCLDAVTGAVLWKTPVDTDYAGSNGPQSTPTVENGKLYTFTASGIVCCLDAGNGKILWKKDLPAELKIWPPSWAFSSSVRLVGRMAVVNAGRGTALDASTGEVLWANREGECGYSTPSVVRFEDREAIAISTVNELNILSPADGKILRSFPWSGRLHDIQEDPLFFGSLAFVSHAYQRGAAFVDMASDPPRALWDDPKLISNLESAVVFDGLIWGNSNPRYNPGDLDGEFFCMEAATGKKLWSVPSRIGTLISVGDYLIRQDQHGTVSIGPRSESGFTAIATLRLFPGSSLVHPAFSAGRLYCKSDGGSVVCVDLRK